MKRLHPQAPGSATIARVDLVMPLEAYAPYRDDAASSCGLYTHSSDELWHCRVMQRTWLGRRMRRKPGPSLPSFWAGLWQWHGEGLLRKRGKHTDGQVWGSPFCPKRVAFDVHSESNCSQPLWCRCMCRVLSQPECRDQICREDEN
jgi:hypothetical protein